MGFSSLETGFRISSLFYGFGIESRVQDFRIWGS